MRRYRVTRDPASWLELAISRFGRFIEPAIAVVFVWLLLVGAIAVGGR